MFARYADRVALIDGERTFTYADVDAQSTNLALNLLDARAAAARPRRRAAAERRRVRDPVFRAAEDRRDPDRGARRRTASPRSASSRSSPARRPASTPDTAARFRLRADGRARPGRRTPALKSRIVLGDAPPGVHSLPDLIAQPATLAARRARARSRSIPTDPCIFQLSGGTTGIPKLIPRTHNDYAYNSKVAAEVCGVDDDVGAAAGAADRAQPAARVPRHPGLFVQRRARGAQREHAAGGDVRADRRSTASPTSRSCRRC